MTSNTTATSAIGSGFADAFREIDQDKPDYERMRDIAADLVPFGVHEGELAS